MYSLRTEKPDDFWEVEALYDLCFAPGREALSSYRLRDGIDPVAGLSLVARDPEGILGGAIRYWPVNVGGARALLLGPIAVHPTRQGEGLGGVLVRDSLALAGREPSSWERVILIGDAPYYKRFGFEKMARIIMPPPTNPERVLGKAISPGAWAGIEGKVSRLSPGPVA